MVAIICVLLATVLSKVLPMPCDVHRTLLWMTPVPSKPVPAIVTSRSEPPAVALDGERELIVTDPTEGVGVGDGEGCCGFPFPQAESVKTPATNGDRIIAERNISLRFVLIFVAPVPFQTI